MNSLIPITNRLHDVFVRIGPDVAFDLPQIAVVGGQSAGKSSVLENFVGRDFLPRGSGIVTRRPLILQLFHAPEEYGEFLHCKDQEFFDFEKIRQEIERDTDIVAGTDKAISDIPIRLRIYSPNVVDITLIDLPGLTKVAVGNQPLDIEHQLRKLILDYIMKESCLILAVSTANSDLATSDALTLAGIADPTRSRTIGVITKLDLMDEETDARDILLNKVIPLKRGYVGVVNRSQKNINGKMDIKRAQEAEVNFFRNHVSYQSFANQTGTVYLQKVLNEQLSAHIRDSLPGLRLKLVKKMSEMKREIENLHLDDPDYHVNQLNKMISQLHHGFLGAIKGIGDQVDLTHLAGGVSLNYIYHDMLVKDMDKLSTDEDKLKIIIMLALKNCHGMYSGVFTPDQALRVIVRSQIGLLKTPAMTCISRVTEEFTKIILACVDCMTDYPKLCDETKILMSHYIDERSVVCSKFVQQLLDSESSYINTKHEDFQKPLEDAKLTPTRFRLWDASSDDIFPKMGKSGYLYLSSAGIMKSGPKSLWFVLFQNTLSAYKDDTETDKRFDISLSNVRLRCDESGHTLNSFKNIFLVLYKSDGKYVSKDMKQLTIQGENSQETFSWRTALVASGVFEDDLKLSKPFGPPSLGCLESRESVKPKFDPECAGQVDMIKTLAASYISIVKRTIKDLLPKIITNFIIDETQRFIESGLLPKINKLGPEELIMSGCADTDRRDFIMRTKLACEECLEILKDVSFAMSSPSTLTNLASIGDLEINENHFGGAVGSLAEPLKAPPIPPRPFPKP